MGDKQRGKTLAQYIRINFPKAQIIISVADGNLILAKELTFVKEIIAIDPKLRNRTKLTNIKKIGKNFNWYDDYKCDLIVGLHPDEATGQIVDFVIKNRIPCIIVPCCLKDKYSSECLNKERWIYFLKNLLVQNSFDVEIDLLDIDGANRTLKAIPRTKKIKKL